MMHNGLDDLDRSILELLTLDARASNRELARKLDVSEGTVRNRLRKLLEKRQFQIIAYPNPNLTDDHWRGFIGVKVALGRLDAAVAELAAMEPVRYIAVTSGQFDIILLTEFESRNDMTEFLRHRIAGVEGVVQSESHVILSVLKSLGSVLGARVADGS